MQAVVAKGNEVNVLNRGVGRPSKCLQPDQDSNGERSTAMGFPGQRGIAPTTVELGKEALPTLSR
jgi:hypothetical protein